MAKTKQFTISVDNQPGAVARIAKTLGDSKVNILALLGTAQGTAGTIQLVAEDAKKAKKALDAAGIGNKETPLCHKQWAKRPGKETQYENRLPTKEVNNNSIHATP